MRDLGIHLSISKKLVQVLSFNMDSIRRLIEVKNSDPGMLNLVERILSAEASPVRASRGFVGAGVVGGQSKLRWVAQKGTFRRVTSSSPRK